MPSPIRLLRPSFNFSWFILLLIAGCTCSRQPSPQESMPPEAVVRRFVEISASSHDLRDKERLLALCSGPLYRAIVNMPDEVFRLSYMSGKVKLIDFSIVEATPIEDGMVVHYKAFVQNDQGADPTQETVEREVELSSNEQGWSIRSIRPLGSDQIAFTHGMIF